MRWKGVKYRYPNVAAVEMAEWQEFLRKEYERREANSLEGANGRVMASRQRDEMCANRMECVLVSEHARLPKKGTSSDAGHDLFAVEEIVVEPKSCATISTGLVIKIPAGYHGVIMPRSGLAARQMIGIGGGLIDQGHRGVVKVGHRLESWE